MPNLVSHMTFWAPISTPMTEPTMDTDAQLHVHVAHLAVFGGGHDGFAEDVGQVGADGIGHGKAEDIEGRSHHPGASHPEEAAQHPHREADGHQDEGVELHARQ